MRVQVIVFSFSKKECEALALQMAPLDLNDEAEQKLVEGIFWNAVDCLSDDDRRLPQACMQPRSLDIHRKKLTISLVVENTQNMVYTEEYPNLTLVSVELTFHFHCQ